MNHLQSGMIDDTPIIIESFFNIRAHVPVKSLDLKSKSRWSFSDVYSG